MKEFNKEIQNYRDLINILDEETRTHCIRTAGRLFDIMIYMNMDDMMCSMMLKAAYLHDIGKYYISENILQKRAPLSSLERAVVDLHAYYGHEYLKSLNIEKEVCELVLFHHGMSKPHPEIEPMSRKTILLSNILRTVDAYDALITKRAYHNAFSKKEAVKIMKTAKEPFDFATVLLLLNACE